MRDVKKVLEMRSQNYSQRQISVSLKISRDTIRKIFNVADDKKVCWSSVKDLRNQMSKIYYLNRRRKSIYPLSNLILITSIRNC